MKIKSQTYVTVDIETTGLSSYKHKITEISALKVHKSKILNEFTTLINPETRIPRFITRLTGIDNEMVENAPTIDCIIPQVNNFLGDLPFIGHNARFDFNFLDHASRKYLDKPLKNPLLCTCRLARRLHPELTSKKLDVLCEHYGIINNSEHRARGDALATVQLFEKFLNKIKKNSLDDLMNLQKSKIPKLRLNLDE